MSGQLKHVFSSITRGLFIFILLFISCVRNDETNNLVRKSYSRDLDSILTKGELKVLISNNSSGYFIYRGKPMGFEYELLQRYANSMGLKLSVKNPNTLEELFYWLETGKGDVAAAELAVTKERLINMQFTEYLMTTRQVLVQRKPDEKSGKRLIRNQIHLIGKKVHVVRNSSFYSRLKSLSDEIGGEIDIILEPGNVETEDLIRQVSQGNIDYTIADEEVAQLNATYFPNLDVSTPISFPQRLAWAVRKNSPRLLKSLNAWIVEYRKSLDYKILYNKYYKNPKAHKARMESGFHSFSGGRISQYDDLIRTMAHDDLHWDWRLLSSLVFEESRFDNSLESWAGAWGLMQVMPETARNFGYDEITQPEANLKAGISYLKWLDNFWTPYVRDSSERIYFIIASYNAGHAHVLDAYQLAKKFGNNPAIWTNSTEYFLMEKSNHKYYTDRAVQHGYCRGYQSVDYVRKILDRYHQYQSIIPE